MSPATSYLIESLFLGKALLSGVVGTCSESVEPSWRFVQKPSGSLFGFAQNPSWHGQSLESRGPIIGWGRAEWRDIGSNPTWKMEFSAAAGVVVNAHMYVELTPQLIQTQNMSVLSNFDSFATLEFETCINFHWGLRPSSNFVSSYRLYVLLQFP